MSDSPKSNSPQPILSKRSLRVRWSLRVLIAVITLACVLFARVGSLWHRGQVHEEVGTRLMGMVTDSPEAVNRNPVTVRWALTYHYIEHSPGGGLPLVPMYKGGPPWMRETGMEPIWQRINSITLDYDNMSEEQLDVATREIARLGYLEELVLAGFRLPEEHMARMIGPLRLDVLFASNAEISTGRLPWLRNTGLERLDLSYTQFSNPAIDDLPSTLVQLDLSATKIDDDGLIKFVRLSNLERLGLIDTPTSEEAIESLRKQMPWCEIDWSQQGPR